ncbi:MAG: low molecular weight protein-tyrosine-phosphatase [Steroidobacteraceae bacterium]
MRLLFVCMGNICRSPTAEAVFRHIAAREAPGQVCVADSAGTHDYHIGAAPDPRAQAAALKRGVDLSALRARQLVPEDFQRFDRVLVMDRRNLRDAARIAPRGSADKLVLLLDYAPEQPLREVPDPYYGTAEDFERVLDLTSAAARGLLARLR